MRKYGLKPLGKRKRFHKPDDQNKKDSEIPNLIKHICPIRPSVVWVGDFTYLNFHNKLYFLATVMDLYTREILGWSFSDHHNAELVIEAFAEAKKKHQITPQYCHSDQGSEYDSYKYKKLVKSHKAQVSMSKKASPWENGYQESWYGNFKKEIDHKNLNRFPTLGELVEVIALHLHYYNHDRIHTSLKTSPVKFRQNLTIHKVFKETGTWHDDVNTYLAKLDAIGVVYQLEWKVDEDDLTAVVTYYSRVAIPADLSEPDEAEA